MECARLGQACLRGGNRGAPDRISLRFYGLTPAPSGEALTDSQKSAAAWAAIVALCVLTLWLLAPVLAPFVVAAVLAYALTPLVDWFDARFRGALPRVLAVGAGGSMVLLPIGGVVLFSGPIFV